MSPDLASLGTGIGSWVKLPAPEVTEVLGLAGADFVVVDLSNSALTMQDVSRHIVAVRAARIPCWVRLEEGASSSMVSRLLDTGADGVVVPHVVSAAQAREYVDAAFFAPDGTRGMGGTTRGGQWLLNGLPFYLESARRDEARPAVSIMIESSSALDALEEIATIGGLAQLFVGPADLSVALGVPGEVDHRSVADAMDRVIAIGHKYGVKVATATGNAAAARALFDRGFDAVVVGNDIGMLGIHAKSVFSKTREDTLT